GMHRLVTIDLHAGQIQGFFNCPVDNLFAAPVFLDYLRKVDGDMVMVSPDAGGVERARAYAKRMNAGLAIIDKRRDAPNQAQAMHLIGNVKGKVAVVMDDMIDTAGTMCAAAEVLMNNGAEKVLACATHPVLSGPALDRLEKSAFSEVVVSNTIPLDSRKQACSKIKVLSMAALLAKAINNVHTESSVSVLFV
ncbi:ribose-phosphate diphosphokinase, partial [Desulfovibrio sp.]